MERWLTPRQLVWLWAMLAVSALAIIGASELTRLDLIMADWMFDAQLHVFPGRHAFFFETIMHAGAKQLLVSVWCVVVVLAALPNTVRPSCLSKPMQFRLRWVATLAVINSGLVSWLKHHMPHACPWDITRYGGALPWFSTFERHTPVMVGHCFPAGHATSGLWLSALCLLWLPHQPRKALATALLGLATGLLLGWSQQMRGAHFLSHTLSSVWLMCALLLCVLSFTRSHTSCTHDF